MMTATAVLWTGFGLNPLSDVRLSSDAVCDRRV
jgi:hypothetical protein